MKSKFYKILLPLLAAVTFFASCNLGNLQSEKEDSDNCYLSVSVDLPSEGRKVASDKSKINWEEVNTIILEMDGEEIKTWKGDDFDTVSEALKKDDTVSIPFGYHDFTIYLKTAKTVAGADETTETILSPKGIASINNIKIVKGKNPLNFAIDYDESGKGSVDVKVYIPSEEAAGLVLAGLFTGTDENGELIPLEGFNYEPLTEVTTEDSGKYYRYAKSSVPAGEYAIKFMLPRASITEQQEIYEWEETVEVTVDCPSENSFTLPTIDAKTIIGTSAVVTPEEMNLAKINSFKMYYGTRVVAYVNAEGNIVLLPIGTGSETITVTEIDGKEATISCSVNSTGIYSKSITKNVGIGPAVYISSNDIGSSFNTSSSYPCRYTSSHMTLSLTSSQIRIVPKMAVEKGSFSFYKNTSTSIIYVDYEILEDGTMNIFKQATFSLEDKSDVYLKSTLRLGNPRYSYVTLYYTTDGSEPTLESEKVTSSYKDIPFEGLGVVGEPVTVKVIEVLKGSTNRIVNEYTKTYNYKNYTDKQPTYTLGEVIFADGTAETDYEVLKNLTEEQKKGAWTYIFYEYKEPAEGEEPDPLANQLGNKTLGVDFYVGSSYYQTSSPMGSQAYFNYLKSRVTKASSEPTSGDCYAYSYSNGSYKYFMNGLSDGSNTWNEICYVNTITATPSARSTYHPAFVGVKNYNPDYYIPSIGELYEIVNPRGEGSFLDLCKIWGKWDYTSNTSNYLISSSQYNTTSNWCIYVNNLTATPGTRDLISYVSVVQTSSDRYLRVKDFTKAIGETVTVTKDQINDRNFAFIQNSDTSVIRTSMTADKVEIKPVKAGTATITVSCIDEANPKTRNYPATYTIEVTVDENGVVTAVPSAAITFNTAKYSEYITTPVATGAKPVAIGTKAADLPVPEVKEGYAFAGYYFDAAFTNPVTPDYVVTDIITLYTAIGKAIDSGDALATFLAEDNTEVYGVVIDDFEMETALNYASAASKTLIMNGKTITSNASNEMNSKAKFNVIDIFSTTKGKFVVNAGYLFVVNSGELTLQNGLSIELATENAVGVANVAAGASVSSDAVVTQKENTTLKEVNIYNVAGTAETISGKITIGNAVKGSVISVAGKATEIKDLTVTAAGDKKAGEDSVVYGIKVEKDASISSIASTKVALGNGVAMYPFFNEGTVGTIDGKCSFSADSANDKNKNNNDGTITTIEKDAVFTPELVSVNGTGKITNDLRPADEPESEENKE